LRDATRADIHNETKPTLDVSGLRSADDYQPVGFAVRQADVMRRKVRRSANSYEISWSCGS
jgi:hypothetical protein